MSSIGQALGTVGGAIAGFFIGGPKGAYYGAQIGYTLGGVLDPPKGQTQYGPRLQDLSVQTSTYGAPIPRVYGTVAVNGNVFWLENNRLKETVHKEDADGGKGGGGGGGEIVTYTYSATFAVGLCEGPITGVRRIWVGSKLIYDAGSLDINVRIASGIAAESFRVYMGDDTQTADTRMEAALGAANAPAYRGLAYIVFYDLPLKEYGNTLLGAQVKAEVVRSGSFADRVETVLAVEFDGAPGSLDFPDTGIYNVTPTISTTEPINEYKNGWRGNCWNVPVGASEYVSYSGAHLVPSANEEVTIDFWVWYEWSANYTASPVIFFYSLDGGMNGTFNVVNYATSPLIAINTPNFGSPDLSASYSAQEWTHVAITLSSTSLELFIDGKSRGVIASGFPSGGSQASTAEIKLGGGTGPGSVYIDRFRVLRGARVWTGNFSKKTDPYIATDAAFNIEVMTANTDQLADVVAAEMLKTGTLSSGDIDVAALSDSVRGYRIAGVVSPRAAIEQLQAAHPFDMIQSGYQIKAVPRGQPPALAIGLDDCLRMSDGARLQESREMDTQLPRRLSIKYLEAEREYDIGEQYAERLVTHGENISVLDLALVMNGDEAAQTAERLLYLYWMERTQFSFELPFSFRGIEPADVLTVSGSDFVYDLRLVDVHYRSDGRIECAARVNRAATYTSTVPGAVGASTGQSSLGLASQTWLDMLDLPCVTSELDAVGCGAVASAVGSWPGAVLYRSADGGQTFKTLAAFDVIGTVGTATNIIATQPAHGIDATSVLTVELDSGTLSSVTQSALFNGANHFAYGRNGRWEIIAAQNCVMEMDGSYTLTNLLRGRFGTELYMGSHAINDDVILLDGSLLRLGMDQSLIGAQRLYRAVTSGQNISQAANHDFSYQGRNLECLAPVYLNGWRDPSSFDWTLTWIRRTRVGGEWRDYVDAPVSEAAEAYEVDIFTTSSYDTLKRTISASAATCAYTSAQQVADFGSNRTTLYLRVHQISALVGRGDPLTVSITR